MPVRSFSCYCIFDGIDDCVDFGSKIDDMLADVEGLSVLAWYNAFNLYGGRQVVGDYTWNAWSLQQRDHGYWVFTHCGRNYDTVSWHNDKKNAWIHVAGVWDRSNLYAYVNGSLVKSKATTQPLRLNPATRIGASHSYDFWLGLIREVLIYRRALNSEEVKDVYEGVYPKDGLILHVVAHPNYIQDTDGDGVLEWIDISGCENHGKIIGARFRGSLFR